MMALEQIKKKLEVCNLQAVAEATKLHPNTIYKLMKPDSNPSYQTVKVLSEYFENWSA
jgi:DNA-binding phage protein